MNASNELRQQMWELCYDLLPPDERAALVAKIKSDPGAARLYAEVRLQADLVGYASKVEDSSLVLSVDGKGGKLAKPAGGRHKAAALATESAGNRSKSAGINWFSAAAALVLVGLIGYGYFRPMSAQQQITFVVTELNAEGSFQEGLSHPVAVRTFAIDRDGNAGAGESAAVDVRVVDADGRERFRKVLETDAEGRGTIDLPGEALVPGARLEAEPLAKQSTRQSAGQAEAQASAGPAVKAALPVQAEPPLAYLMLEKPMAEPGETVKFSLQSLSPFSFEPRPAQVDELVVQGRDGAAVVHPMWTSDADASRIDGEVQLPAQSRHDLDLIARNNGEQATSRNLFTERFELQQGQNAGVLSARRAIPAPSAPGEDLRKAGTAAPLAGNRAREYERADQNGLVVAEAAKKIVEPGQPVAIDVPAQLRGKSLVATAVCRDVTVATEFFGANQSDKAGGKESKGEQITLDLPLEVDGEIRVALADSARSNRVLHEETYYRMPARELKVEVADLKKRDDEAARYAAGFQDDRNAALDRLTAEGLAIHSYAPGETVRLKFKVQDESHRPTAATLSMRVWSEEAIRASGNEPTLLADAVRSPRRESRTENEQLASAGFAGRKDQQLKQLAYAADARQEKLQELKKAKGLIAADASGAPQANADRPEAQAGAAPLGDFENGSATRDGYFDDLAFAGVAPAPAESLVATNRDAVTSAFRTQAADLERQWQVWQSMMGRILVVGGLVVLSLLGLVTLARRPIRASSGALTLLAAAASLAVGVMWMNAAPQEEMQIAALPKYGADEAFSQPEPQPAATKATDISAGLEVPVGRVDRSLERSPAPLTEAPSPQEPAAAASAPASSPSAPPAPPPTAAPPAPTTPPALAARTSPEDAPTATAPAAGPAAALPTGKDGQGGGRGAGTFGGSLPGGAPPSEAELRAKPEFKPGNIAPSGKPDVAEKAATVKEAGDSKADAKKGADKPSTDLARAIIPNQPAKPSAAAANAATAGGAAPGGQPADRPAEIPSPQPAVTDRLGSSAPTQIQDEKATLEADAAKKQAERLKASGAAPMSLYFNPHLPTDEHGFVTIEFQMPAVPSEYRLLIDAVGQGRIGSMQVILVCGEGK